MNDLVRVLVIYSLAFLIKEKDGPFNIINWCRRMFVNLGGPLAYQLMNCYYCLGFHCGWLVYLLTEQNPTLSGTLLWGLTGAGGSLILDSIISRPSQSR